jgi:hypothetical protein
VQAGIVVPAAVREKGRALHGGDLDERLDDGSQADLPRQRHAALLGAAGLQGGQEELERERVAHVHHVGPHGAGLQGGLAHGIEVVRLPEVERQRDHFVAFHLDQVPYGLRLGRPTRERERDARPVSH